MTSAGKGMGGGPGAQHGAKGAGAETRPEDLEEVDLERQEKGYNRLQGDDQANVRNERKAQADVKKETDDPIESMEKLDKDRRAREDLGKGNRASSNSRED